MTKEKADALFAELGAKIREIGRHASQVAPRAGQGYFSRGISLGLPQPPGRPDGGEGWLEQVDSRVYWHPEHGKDAGHHLDLTDADTETAWSTIKAGFPKRLRLSQFQDRD